MSQYRKTNPEIWSGRKSSEELYLHEKVQCINIEKESVAKNFNKSFTIFGYACDEGVRRNQGRIGAFEGPDAIRKVLAKMPNHLDYDTALIDAGSLSCEDGKLEIIQEKLANKVTQLLQQNNFPILLGGGHDIAYGHYNGIKNFLGKDKTIGIINFDAHFDLRSNENGNNSGTPFYQIAEDCKKDGTPFKYICLGIRKDANDFSLFTTARELQVNYIERSDFVIQNMKNITNQISDFIKKVNYVYATIDLDGFSSAYAPGVSASSPMGFAPDVVLACLKMIINSQKLISVDIAEMNSNYDIDNQTAKLAASLIHAIINSS